MTQERTVSRAEVHVHYPLGEDYVVLRADPDWTTDIAPAAIDQERTISTFEVPTQRPFVAYKPCLRRKGELLWARGTNKIAFPTRGRPERVYPFFVEEHQGRITELLSFPSRRVGKENRLRVYLPPGYAENPLKRYPTIYMHDGGNLFFPDEAFLGHDWQVDRTIELLGSMNLADQAIVVGIHAGDRMDEYTKPGYETYGEALVGEIKPWVDQWFRTLPGPGTTGVVGSSLGGVVSFFLLWQWPDVFGAAGCLSSTFSYKDDLIERVLAEPPGARLGARFYLDSGWPGDNYEVTIGMANAMISRGFTLGHNLMHLAFPYAAHNEQAWASRFHIPLQMFLGKLGRNPASRGSLGFLPSEPPERLR